MSKRGNVVQIFREDSFAARLAEARIIARDPKAYMPATVKAAACILAASPYVPDRMRYCKLVGVFPRGTRGNGPEVV